MGGILYQERLMCEASIHGGISQRRERGVAPDDHPEQTIIQGALSEDIERIGALPERPLQSPAIQLLRSALYRVAAIWLGENSCGCQLQGTVCYQLRSVCRCRLQPGCFNS